MTLKLQRQSSKKLAQRFQSNKLSEKNTYPHLSERSGAVFLLPSGKKINRRLVDFFLLLSEKVDFLCVSCYKENIRAPKGDYYG